MTLQEQGPPVFYCVVLDILVLKILVECSDVFNFFSPVKNFFNVNGEMGNAA